jgi:hypothetical protein
MSTGDLPPWPERGCDLCKQDPEWVCLMCNRYDRNLANAAIARLRKAVEVLRVVGQYIDVLPGTIQADFFDGCPDVEEALALIGDIPER